MKTSAMHMQQDQNPSLLLSSRCGLRLGDYGLPFLRESSRTLLCRPEMWEHPKSIPPTRFRHDLKFLEPSQLREVRFLILKPASQEFLTHGDVVDEAEMLQVWHKSEHTPQVSVNQHFDSTNSGKLVNIHVANARDDLLAICPADDVAMERHGLCFFVDSTACMQDRKHPSASFVAAPVGKSLPLAFQ